MISIRPTILTRYIFSEAFIFFAMSILCFTGILLTIRMLHFASLIVNKGVEPNQIISVFVAIIPTFLEVAIPMSTLVGVLLAFARLSGDSELIVMRASGISLTQLVRPVLLFGVLSSLLTLSISHHFKPLGYRMLSEKLFEIARSKSTSGLSEGVFNKLGNLTLYADSIDYQNGSLTHVLIDDKRDKTQRKIITAQTGRIQSNAKDRTITLFLNQGLIHEMIEKRYMVTRYHQNSIVVDASQLFGDDLASREKPTREMDDQELLLIISETRSALNALRESENPPPAGAPAENIHPQSVGGDTPSTSAALPNVAVPSSSPTPPPLTRSEQKKRLNQQLVDFHSRFSMPFAPVVLALIAMSLGVIPPRTQRTWGAGFSVSVGLLVFALYYGLLSLGMTLAQNGKMPVPLAVWLPNGVMLLFAVALLKKIGSEQWQSASQAVEPLILALSKVVHRKVRA